MTPLTVSAIVDHIKNKRSAAGKRSKSERAYLADFTAAENPGAFIENSFLDAAMNDGETLRQESYSGAREQAEEPEEESEEDLEDGGWHGIHKFLDLYVVNFTKYGEWQEEYGPYATLEDAEAVFDSAVALHAP